MKKMPMTLAASIPPITVVPMIWRATDPAPDAVHSGTLPRMKAKDVIRIGRSRSLAPSRAASMRFLPFANEEFAKGKNLIDAALEGARLRLRPILMTSFAFILGSVPLWTASGAGSVARQIMGTTVIGGMFAASVLGIFLIPASFVVVKRIAG